MKLINAARELLLYVNAREDYIRAWMEEPLIVYIYL